MRAREMASHRSVEQTLLLEILESTRSHPGGHSYCLLRLLLHRVLAYIRCTSLVLKSFPVNVCQSHVTSNHVAQALSLFLALYTFIRAFEDVLTC